VWPLVQPAGPEDAVTAGTLPPAQSPAPAEPPPEGAVQQAVEAVEHRVEELVEELRHDAVEAVHALEEIFRPPVRPDRVWHGAGFAERAERWFEGIAWGVVMLLAAGWAWSIAVAHTAEAAESAAAGGRGAPNSDARATRGLTPATAAVTAAFRDPSRPTTAYLTDAAMTALTDLRGESGKLRLVVRAPGEPLASGAAAGEVVTTPDSASAASRRAPQRVAVRVGADMRPVNDLRVLTLTPLTARRNGRIGLYYIGAWPTEGERAPRGNYAAPRGLIEVTRETQDTPVSEHLRIRDFLTHDQQNVWPKYVVIDPRNVDKIELVLADLERRGVRARGVHVMSGFRTPQYNRAGGDARGRAGLSRHMYGDAADIWIDGDGDGQMDDLDHDGRHGIGDARAVCEAVDRVEREHPELVGGCGYYPGNGAHGPFTHIDARGYRARWVGSGDGG
jgi:uncharacterized protein YcbK (DUF882 family)